MYCNIVFMIDIFVISKITQYRYYVIAITDVRSLGLSTKWRTLMIKKTMKVRENTFRKLEDPFENGAAKKYVFYVKVDDVAEGIPMATNPRDQKLTSGVATAIKESLLSNDGYFHLKNRGIVLSAESVHYNNKEKIATIIFSDELSHGNIDGGHTYKIVCEHKGENLEQYVQFEVMTGVEDIIENLAEARNTSVVLNSRDNGYDPQDNHQLVVMFKNHQDDNKQYQLQEEKFENLFGGWEIGLTEAVEKEKGKSAIIKYDKYEINGGQLIFNLIDCEKKSIDELMPPTRFVVESQGQKGVIYTEVGNFEEVVCDDDSVKIVLSLTKGRLKPTVRQLLNKNTPLLEDFRAKTMAYKRQFRAIFDLKKDEYSARSLKDIILCLDEPEEIKTISQPSFISKVLNQSQKQAVMKALNTENICLIQGPPGTGKTSVIKEIVGQIIKRDIKMTDSPKILIVSQSHTAVDNILEGLGKAIDNPLEIIRIGAERNISEEIATKYTIAAHREQLVSEIKNNVQQYVEQKK